MPHNGHERQSVQSAAARLICYPSKHDHVSEGQRNIHWAHMMQRMNLKCLCLIQKACYHPDTSFLTRLIPLYKHGCSLGSERQLLLEV